jgi:hypothetical protein
VATIATKIHSSDTGVFGSDGSADPARIAGIFDRFDLNRSGSLSGSELAAMRTANKTDFLGGLASKGEFDLLLSVARDRTERENGKYVPAISRARLEALYDGSLFETIAAERGGRR